jgi:hypothetical protein
MADTVMSLFGVTPESYQAEREAALYKQAADYAQLDPFQRANMGLYMAGNRLGGAVGGMFGAEDPGLVRIRQNQELLQGVDLSDPAALRAAAQKAMSSGNYGAASQLAQKALDVEAKQASTKKDIAETQTKLTDKLTPEQKNAAGLADTVAQRGTPEWSKAYGDSLKELTARADTKTEFERILGSLGLSPEQEKAYRQQWVTAKLNPDPSGMKSLQAALVNLQVQQVQDKLDTAREAKAVEKKTAINKLSDAESALDTSLSTAAKALKLAPENFKEATGQALLDTIPWTDAKSLKNLVSTLQSEKVTGTLEQLKSQSRTGATGFGALSEKELTLLINKIASLDPTDKMFKQNLVTVMDEWKRVQRKVKDSRQELMGIGGVNQNYEDLISRTINYNKGKGTMSRTQALELLKASGKIPSNY